MTSLNLELFPCSGGMAEGFRRAGITFDLAFDKDPNAIESYAANLGHRPIGLDVNDLDRMTAAGWRSPPIALLVADPPCTPWSRAGRRAGLGDARDCLQVTADLIVRLRPAAYLIGNVPGLQDAPSWGVVQKVIGGLAAHGYCVADYVSLDAADYGVPQHRIRPFWFGHLEGPCIRWPAPTHGAPTRQGAIRGQALAPWVTCRDALRHLPVSELGRAVKMIVRPPGDAHPQCKVDAPAPTVRGGGDGHSAPQVVLTAAAGRRHGIGFSSPDKPAAAITRNDRGEGATLLKHRKHPVNRGDIPSYAVTAKGDCRGAQGACALEWPWDRPATTVHEDNRLASPGHHDPGIGSSTRHGENAIILSERAAAILQGFPDGWVFAGATKKARWSQLGQAMPPPLAEAVARAVAEQQRARWGEVSLPRVVGRA